MGRYLIKRLLLLLPTLVGVTILASLLMRMLPAGIVDIVLAELGYGHTEADRQRVARMLGVDKPWPAQYGNWLKGIVQGDFGESLRTRRAIGEELSARLPVTLELAALSLVFSLVIAVPAGIVAAVRPNTPLDYVARSFAIGGLAIPGFWLATLVVVWPAIWWGWSPPLSYSRLWQDPLGNLSQMWLPALLMSLYLAGYSMRMVRSMMLEVLSQDYIRTAWAKGLRERVVIVRHALKNGLMPVVTLVGLQVPVVIGYAVVFEAIFGLPGIGDYLINAAATRDYTVLQALVLVMAVVVVLVNLMVDISYAYIDPRVRLEG